MNYQQIIDHYYVPGKLRDILMVHSRKVADKALKICKDSEQKAFIEAAAMLHDIGIILCDASGIECYVTEPYICHGRIGAQMLREDAHLFGLSQEEIEPYARVCERHTGADQDRPAPVPADTGDAGTVYHRGLLEQLLFRHHVYDKAEYVAAAAGAQGNRI